MRSFVSGRRRRLLQADGRACSDHKSLEAGAALNVGSVDRAGYCMPPPTTSIVRTGSPEMATLRDIARIVGVDPSTVSRVVNADPKLSIRPETRQKILRAAEKLDYHPNAVARGLRRGRTNTFAMLIPDISNFVYAEIIRGAERAAGEAGYYLLLANTADRTPREAGYVKLLSEGRVDGVVMASALVNDEVIEWLNATRFPYVLVNRRSRAADRFVVLDDSGGAEQAVRCLLERGHRRIAHLAGPLYAGTALERFHGYRQALSKANAPFDSELVVECAFTEEGGAAGMRRLLDSGRLPDGIFAANIRVAFGALSVLAHSGIRVPEDVSLIAIHDHPLAALMRPSLATVRMPLFKMGFEAVKLLLRELQGDAGPMQVVLEDTELVLRDSVATRSISSGPLPQD